jgi:hypothetical protein
MPYAARLFIAALVAVLLYGAFHMPKAPQTTASEPAPAVPAPPTPEEETRYAKCKLRLADAASKGILVDAKPDPFESKVYVGRPFYALTPDQKDAFLEDLNCLAEHGRSTPHTFAVIDRFNSHRIGTYRMHRYSTD